MSAVDLQASGSGLIPYRPGLDGLRAVAVGGVLLFHGGFTWLAGGFLGVSMFFTLSGFLITSLLVAEQTRDGHIDLRHFWSRRFRRLLPAALLALAGIGVFGLTVATAEQAERLSGDIAAALAYVANWRFVLGETSYGELWSEPSPVLHFWSLAIEEQFYVVLPLLVGVTFWLGKGRRGVLAAVLAVVTAASVGSAFVLGTGDLDRIYFGTDTRAAEMLVGSLLAVGVAMAGPRLRERAGWVLTFAGAAALVALGALMSLVDTSTMWLYEGGLPAIALLSALTIHVATREGPLARVLSVRPLHWLGTRSYGIYLFHWPVFLWLDPDTVGTDGVALFALRLAVTFAIAEVSYRFVESPIRHRRALRRTFLPAIPPASAVVLAIGLVATATAPAPLMFIDQTVDALPPPPTVVDDGATRPVELDGDAEPRTWPYVLIGDSFATLLDDELESALQRRSGVELHDATSEDCTWYQVVVEGGTGGCADLVDRWAEESAGAELVVVSLGVGSPAFEPRGEVDETRLLDGLRTLRGRLPDTTEVVWVTQPLLLEAGAPEARLVPAAETAWAALDQLSRAVAAVGAEHEDQVLDLAAYMTPPERPDGTAVLDHDAAVITLGLGWIADQLSRPRAPDGVIRLLIVGDSIAYNLGRGFEQVAADRSDLSVWNVGTAGCGLVRAGESPPDEFQPSVLCDLWPDRFEEQIEVFDPHLVFVVSGGWDLLDRRRPGWDEFKEPGDPVYDAYLQSEYEFALDVLTARGAKVVWGITPCVAESHSGSVFAADRKVYQVRVLEALDAAHDDLTLLDLDPLACPDGRFTNTMGEIRNFRPDGVHYSDEGARWMAGRLIPTLLAPWSPGVDAWSGRG